MSDEEHDLLLDLDDDIGPIDDPISSYDENNDNDMNDDDNEEEEDEQEEKTVIPIVKPVSKSRLKKKTEAAAARGVIYLSRIPPYMKPSKIRHIFSQYGDIDRVYLVPEGKTIVQKSSSVSCFLNKSEKKKKRQNRISFCALLVSVPLHF